MHSQSGVQYVLIIEGLLIIEGVLIIGAYGLGVFPSLGLLIKAKTKANVHIKWSHNVLETWLDASIGVNNNVVHFWAGASIWEH